MSLSFFNGVHCVQQSSVQFSRLFIGCFDWVHTESVATLPPFSPIEVQKWFDQISSQWESQKNRFALTNFGKIQFLPPCIWNLPFVSTATGKLTIKSPFCPLWIFLRPLNNNRSVHLSFPLPPPCWGEIGKPTTCLKVEHGSVPAWVIPILTTCWVIPIPTTRWVITILTTRWVIQILATRWVLQYYSLLLDE